MGSLLAACWMRRPVFFPNFDWVKELSLIKNLIKKRLIDVDESLLFTLDVVLTLALTFDSFISSTLSLFQFYYLVGELAKHPVRGANYSLYSDEEQQSTSICS